MYHILAQRAHQYQHRPPHLNRANSEHVNTENTPLKDSHQHSIFAYRDPTNKPAELSLQPRRAPRAAHCLRSLTAKRRPSFLQGCMKPPPQNTPGAQIT